MQLCPENGVQSVSAGLEWIGMEDLDDRVREYAIERGGISHQEALRELASAYLSLIDTIQQGGTAIAVAALNAAATVDEPWPPPAVMEQWRR